MQNFTSEMALDPVNEGRCTNMHHFFGAAFDYSTNSGCHLIAESEEMVAIVFKLINGLVNIGQGGVALLLLERCIHLGPPSPGQLFQSAHIQIPVMKKSLQFRHVLDQKASILPDAVAAHGRSLVWDIPLQKQQ